MNVLDAIYRFFDRPWVWWMLIVVVAADLTICGFTWGKHRLVVVEGAAWAWVNAPPGAEGTVYVVDTDSPENADWTPPAGMDLVRLDKVYITFYARYNNFSEQCFRITSKAGTFSQHTTPWEMTGNIRVDLTAERDGYATVNTTFVNRSNYFLKTTTNVVNIILVPSG